ncbi:MAG: wax ester/triacylglycerol synthase family O-acyltransferase [Deltaproteobacteria bacterium]|nr:wax ester/triacylglycerol synthase family O-acyltransferase [Deltaproteobacteria bacterium]
MPHYMYERLSAQDNSFLVAEDVNSPLHISAVGIYELGQMATRDGGVDIRRFRRFIEARLHEIPRYRQKLMWVPVENRAVWVDDAHFNIDYHIRHTALPRPGGVEELKKLTARITTRVLDRSRPMWEIWVIEGLESDRFAIVSKIHHCMIDGAAGADLAQILNSPSPEVEIPEPRPFIPRPAPSESELFVDLVRRFARMPLATFRGLASLRPDTTNLAEEIETRVRALGDLVGMVLTPSSDTPMNGPLGPHRHIDWLTLPLDDVKAVRRKLDCTVNDVVLATVTGAVRHYLSRRGVDPGGIDFRVSAPVSMRGASDRGKMGNRVSAWILRLPIEQDDPMSWVSGIRETTRELKKSRQALGLEMMMQAAEYAPASLMALGARVASGPINMIVTNVPGPQFPLYTLGAKLLEIQPLVPLLEGTGLGIALFSYDGKLHIGLNAEYELVPDLGTFTTFFAQSFMAIADAAGTSTQTDASAEKPAAEVEVAPCVEVEVTTPEFVPVHAATMALSASVRSEAGGC